MNNFEEKIKKWLISELDDKFNTLADTNFNNLTDDGEDASEDECDEIESIFMSYRNVIAGTEWDGEQQEYEKYEVR